MYFSGNVKLPYINFQRETHNELMVLYSVLKVHPQPPSSFDLPKKLPKFGDSRIFDYRAIGELERSQSII